MPNNFLPGEKISISKALTLLGAKNDCAVAPSQWPATTLHTVWKIFMLYGYVACIACQPTTGTECMPQVGQYTPKYTKTKYQPSKLLAPHATSRLYGPIASASKHAGPQSPKRLRLIQQVEALRAAEVRDSCLSIVRNGRHKREN